MEDKLSVLKNFISDYWSCDIKNIALGTSLDDIGMFGDDKYDFLMEFSRKFDVDMSNIKFEEFIEPEPTLLMYFDSLSRTLFNKRLTSKFDVKTISIDMLLGSILKGKWDY